MSGSSQRFRKLEKLVVDDPRLSVTLISYILILVIYINLQTFKSPTVGAVVFIFYFLINGTFLANAFFENEEIFLKLMFGLLLLITFLGLVGWLVMIIYNFDVVRFTLTLLAVATLSSLLSKRMKNKNAK